MKLIKLIFAILFLIITTPIILLLSVIMWFYAQIKRFFVIPIHIKNPYRISNKSGGIMPSDRSEACKPKQPLEVKVFKDENGALSAKSLQEMKRLGFSKFEINLAKNIVQTSPEQEFTYRNGMSSDELEKMLTFLKKTEAEHQNRRDEPPLKELALQQQYLKGEISEEIAVWLFNQGKTEETLEMYQMLVEECPARKPYYKAQMKILTRL